MEIDEEEKERIANAKSWEERLSHITKEQWNELLAKAKALRLKAISEGWDETED